jgi:hypothetical protein
VGGSSSLLSAHAVCVHPRGVTVSWLTPLPSLARAGHATVLVDNVNTECLLRTSLRSRGTKARPWGHLGQCPHERAVPKMECDDSRHGQGTEIRSEQPWRAQLACQKGERGPDHQRMEVAHRIHDQRRHAQVYQGK